jgi:hypothetical protein
MNVDLIKEIGIDDKNQLYIKPEEQKFPYIYREAMGVQWNELDNCLYAPSLHEWSYVDWYKQIINAVKEQSCSLTLTSQTLWVNIPEVLKKDFLNI